MSNVVFGGRECTSPRFLGGYYLIAGWRVPFSAHKACAASSRLNGGCVLLAAGCRKLPMSSLEPPDWARKLLQNLDADREERRKDMDELKKAIADVNAKAEKAMVLAKKNHKDLCSRVGRVFETTALVQISKLFGEKYAHSFLATGLEGISALISIKPDDREQTNTAQKEIEDLLLGYALKPESFKKRAGFLKTFIQDKIVKQTPTPGPSAVDLSAAVTVGAPAAASSVGATSAVATAEADSAKLVREDASDQENLLDDEEESSDDEDGSAKVGSLDLWKARQSRLDEVISKWEARPTGDSVQEEQYFSAISHSRIPHYDVTLALLSLCAFDEYGVEGAQRKPWFEIELDVRGFWKVGPIKQSTLYEGEIGEIKSGGNAVKDAKKSLQKRIRFIWCLASLVYTLGKPSNSVFVVVNGRAFLSRGHDQSGKGFSKTPVLVGKREIEAGRIEFEIL